MQKIIPPQAKKIPVYRVMHGKMLKDDYSWLHHIENEEVMQHMKAEEAYTDAVMKDTEDLQKKLFEEIKSKIKENDKSVPCRKSGYLYYSRDIKGKQYPVHCRKKDVDGAEEEVILDENLLALNQSYCDVASMAISEDQNILAYTLDTSGDEKYVLTFVNLKTGEEMSEKLTDIGSEIEWANDNKTIFYTLLDDTGRAFKIKSHKLGNKRTSDKTIYTEKDAKFTVDIGKTLDRRYIFISSESATSTEFHIINANAPEKGSKVFLPREENVKYYLTSKEDVVYIRTNKHAVNFSIYETLYSEPEPKYWTLVVQSDDNVLLDGMVAFKDYIIVEERRNGLSRLLVTDTRKDRSYRISLGKDVSSTELANNLEFDNDVLRVFAISLTEPTAVYDYDLSKKKAVLLKSYYAGTDFNSDDYESKQIFVTARDGAKVPVSMVWRKDVYKEPAPMLLTSYGSYGVSSDIYFSPYLLPLLDRGIVYAIAHIRGGAEKGRQWYLDGKLLRKKNTFYDFIDVAKALIKRGYTTSEKLAIEGGSAGGLLMGAVCNMEPKLFKAVIAKVPFVDVMNTMLDPTLPLVFEEYEEWGNPNEKQYFDYMLSYSPYDNIKKQSYPHILVTTGINDCRVSYWEPLKYMAKLREYRTDNNLDLVKINFDSGHAGDSGRYDYIKELAFNYAFLFKTLNIKY
ncbi:MAG: S9 family peptidase [Candidatus Riflebacteria bacterium]|nr:S9 family peptidase [Candidatus Riflebacteria bacterium]